MLEHGHGMMEESIVSEDTPDMPRVVSLNIMTISSEEDIQSDHADMPHFVDLQILAIESAEDMKMPDVVTEPVSCLQLEEIVAFISISVGKWSKWFCRYFRC